MKINSTSSCLVLIALIGHCTISVSSETIRVKRQAQQQDARPKNERPVEGAVNRAVASTAPASSMATSTIISNVPMSDLDSFAEVGSSRPSGQARPARPNVRKPTGAPAGESLGFDQDEEGAEVALPPLRRNRPFLRHKSRQNRFNENRDDEGDCDEDGYGDYNNMFRDAFGPMRQMGDMMGNMFEHMQSLASGDFEGLPTGSNFAVASARSDGSGYSRQSSIVNNNGRRRGIISETRNGRTQTRRIGDDDEE